MVENRKKEMKESMKSLGIKKFYLQNIYTRSLKDNIVKTYNKILKLKKNIKLIQFFVLHMKEVIRIMM